MPDLNQIIEDAVANPILSDSAADIGKELLDALITEFTLIPDPTVKNQSVWSTRKEKDQEQTIRRLKDRIRSVVTRGFGQVLAAGNPAAQAKLKDVKFSGEKITAGLEIDVLCKERHALADFASQYVAIIMPDDIDQYFETMDEIVASKDQRSLPLDNRAPADDKSSPAAGDTSDGAQTDEGTGEAEPSVEDIELYEALQSNGVNILLNTVMVWGSEYRESAWKWIETVEEHGKAALPSFLMEYTDDLGSSTADATGDDDLANKVVEKALNDMDKKELVAEALLTAASIGEASTKDGDKGITEKQFKRKTMPGLIEYIEYARGKLSELATEAAVDETVKRADDALQPGMDDVNMTEAEPPVLINELKTVLGLDIPLEDAEEWSEPTRREIRAYLTQISKGVMPDRVPTDLGPYLSAND